MSTIKIFVWPDGSWVSEEEIDGDMDLYLSSCGKSDDYSEYDIPIELNSDEIDELIELKLIDTVMTV